MLRKGRLLICVIVLFLLQACVSHRLSHNYLRFDFIYLLAAFLALEADFRPALWWALGLGLLRDLASTGRLGVSAAVLVPATAGVLLVRNRIYRENVIMDVLLVFLFVLLCSGAEALALTIALPGAEFVRLMGRAMGQAAYTSALAPVCFLFFERIGLIERQASLA